VTNHSDDNARDLTKWAEDRTLLATERTFSTWMGTGFVAVGIAIGLKVVFGATEPSWVAKLVAKMFLAIDIYWAAQRQACKSIDRLTQNDVETQSSKSFTRLAVAMTIATFSTGAVLRSL